MAGQDRQVTGPGGFALGVDLGTSNTVAVLRWPDGRTRPLLFDGQPIMPSGVFADQAGGLHVGRDAQRLAQSEPARYEPNPKRRIDEPGVLLGDREVSTIDMLAAVLGAVARAAVEAVGFLPPAVLTYPAAWGGRRREVLAAAVARAGWPPVDPSAIHTGATPYAGGNGHAGTLLVPEPIAAARYFAEVLRRPVPTGASLAVFDLGGGTLDVAVVRNEGPDASGRARFAVLGSGGVAELGGLDLDAALVDHLGGLLARSAPPVWRQLSAPQTPAQARNRRQFWDDVRGAKEMLSRTATAPVAVPGVDQAVHLTREELERLATPLLRRGVYETARVVADCQLDRSQLAGLFLVGGSSRVPLVARLLHAELGIAPTVLEQPELPVAEGALAELLPPPQSAAMAAAAHGQPAAIPGAAHGATMAGGAHGQPATMAGTAAGAPPTSGPPVSPAPPTVAPVSGGPGGQPYPMRPEGGPRRRRMATWIIVAAAVVAVLLGVGGIVLYLNRGPSDLDFQDVAEIARITTGDDTPPYAFTHTVGDRAYLAWQRDEQLEVASVEAGSGKQRWQQTMPGTSAQWRGVVAYPHVVLAQADNSSSSEPRAVYVLDPDNGNLMWSRDIVGEDQIFVYDDVAVLADTKDKRLVGLDIRGGEERWALDNPKNESDTADASVFAAGTTADLAGAASPEGVPFAPKVDDDYRLVQVGSDRKARVIDARTGKVLAERGNVGDPTGKYLAYEGRFFAVGTGDGYRIDAYDLERMGEPRGIYRAPDTDRLLERLVPCGAERVCVLDSRSADADTREVAAIDASKGGQVWRQPAPQADLLVPVGEGVLVQLTSGTPSWTLRGADGGEVLRRDGTAVRLDAANLLSFVGTLSTSPTDLSVAGVGVNAGKATELGPLREARGDTCSWNSHVITCLTDNKFVLWRFAE